VGLLVVAQVVAVASHHYFGIPISSLLVSFRLFCLGFGPGGFFPTLAMPFDKYNKATDYLVITDLVFRRFLARSDFGASQAILERGLA
jgi:hypothetical protein